LRKSQQTFGAEAKRIEGANLVVVKIPKEEFENLHVSKHPIASQMDVENDNYIIPENIERNYINLDDIQDKVGNFENLQKAKEQIKEKVKQFETKEAVELYREYLKTIFPESKVQDIVWHHTKSDKFEQFNNKSESYVNKDTYTKDGIYFNNHIDNGKEVYGETVIPAVVDIKNPYLFIEEPLFAKKGDNPKKLSLNSIDRKKLDESEDGVLFKPNQKNGQVVVFDPEQIHILGSKTDIEKFRKFVSKKENSVLEKQELYKKIKSEIESVFISENDKDKEGNLLAPNGKKSNLPELEWKMTRTPSFLKFFGNWKEKYNKEQYDLWLKYQEKQTCEDYIKTYQEHQERQRKQSLQALENIRTGEYSEKEKWEKYHLDHIKEYDQFYQKDIIRLSQRISKLQAELINSGFNTHSYDLDYTKVLDENGEPLLLYRGTDFTPDESGKFVIPKKKINGNEFEVGVFFGNEEEAKHHHEGRKIEGKTSKLYKVFVNGRNFKIFDSKPNYWVNPKDSQGWRGKYDGVWVKQNENEETRTDTKVNLFDYIAFNPNDVLIVDVE
jgi:hypothetical protein